MIQLNFGTCMEYGTLVAAELSDPTISIRMLYLKGRLRYMLRAGPATELNADHQAALSVFVTL